MLKEQRDHARHHEMLRATVANISLVIAGGVLTAIGFQKGIVAAHWQLGLLLSFMGAYGAIFTLKQYERIWLHIKRARAHRKIIDEQVAGCNFEQTLATVDKAHKAIWRIIFKTDSNWLWFGLHCVIMVVGICILCVAMKT